MGTLLILGCGYVGEHLAVAAMAQGTRVIGTTRSTERAEALRALGIEAVVADSPAHLADAVLSACDAVVDSIPLERDGSGGMHAPQMQWLPGIGSRLSQVRWAGYLSTTGVYGDAEGAWVDESWPCRPSGGRGIGRLEAEAAWLGSGLPAEVFRIAGIYGPGRNIIPRLREGGYKVPCWQPPHWSNRIHVDDIVAALLAAMSQPRPGRIVNLADDEPLPHADYVSELARLVGAPAPVMLDSDAAAQELSPAALDFFRDNKRVSNVLLHRELVPVLKYPSFRAAAASLI